MLGLVVSCFSCLSRASCFPNRIRLALSCSACAVRAVLLPLVLSRPVFAHSHAVGLSCASVAVCVFWSGPCGAVLGVSEVPCVAACDGLSAFCAGDGVALGQVPYPSGPFGLVSGIISALAGCASLGFVGVLVGLAIACSARYELRAVVP